MVVIIMTDAQIIELKEEESVEVLGTITSDESTPTFDKFRFKAKPEKYVSPGTLIATKLSKNKYLIGRVSSSYEFNPHESASKINVRDKMNINPEYPDESLSLTIYRQYDVEIIEEVKIVNKKYIIYPPETLPLSGSQVFIPSKDLIMEVMGLEKDSNKSYNIGHLGVPGSSENKIAVNLKRKIIQRHVFICGTTGSGKSYAAKVLAEEINKQKVPIIFFDTQKEFAPLVKENGGTILRPGDNYFVKLSSLSEDELLALVPTLKTEHQISLLSTAFLRLKNPDMYKKKQITLIEEKPDNFNVNDLIRKIDEIWKELGINADTYKTVRQRTLGYISRYNLSIPYDITS